MVNGLDFALILLAVAVAAGGIVAKARRIALGQPEARSGDLRARIGGVCRAVLRHDRILRDQPEGRHHLYLFYAFVIPLTVIVVVQVAFALPPVLARPLGLALDLVAGFGLFGTVRLYQRRYGEQPDRLDNRPEDRWALILLMAIFVTGFLTEASRLSLLSGFEYLWNPIGFALAIPLHLLPEPWRLVLVELFWRLHLYLVLFTLASLPYGKLGHIPFGVANIFLRNLGPKGAFRPIDIETAEVYGVGQVEQFTRKQLLDLEACVRCGRCQARCPAYNTGKSLSPKKVIQDLRAHWIAKAPCLRKGQGDAFEQPMIEGGGVSHDDIWACTTCRHCMETCPMMIEHVDKIVDMRRYLVLMEGQMPQELVTLNKNLENNFNPWGVGWSARNDWMTRRKVSPRILTEEENPEFEVLLWVGCAGAYDDRYQRVVASVCRLLDRAGVSYGVLGTQEKCCGDPARASGNEYLYQTLVAENIAAMDALGVKKILASCPHCLKTLSKEYPQFGGSYEVVHHSQFLLELMTQGRLRTVRDLPGRLTFHDSCYLSRYADIVAEPRRLLGSVQGLELAEMPRSGTENFCCGAGGGRMWMEEEGTRINNVRAEEALATGADLIGAACPFCLTMLTDGVKAQKKEEEVQVLDIAEILERVTA